MASGRIERAVELMERFAERTELGSGRAAVRYLWTDAFAVCHWLGLAETTGNSAYRELARSLRRSADVRLAFRELGLAIGLRATTRTSPPVEGYAPLADEILTFWQDPEHQGSRIWIEHRDINEVMLATALAPEGFLDAPPAAC